MKQWIKNTVNKIKNISALTVFWLCLSVGTAYVGYHAVKGQYNPVEAEYVFNSFNVSIAGVPYGTEVLENDSIVVVIREKTVEITATYTDGTRKTEIMKVFGRNGLGSLIYIEQNGVTGFIQKLSSSGLQMNNENGLKIRYENYKKRENSQRNDPGHRISKSESTIIREGA
jgi:hypothetical protein